MKNISESFLAACKRAPDWKLENFESLMDKLMDLLGAWTNWDDEENWACLLNEQTVVAMVMVRAPLLVVDAGYEEMIETIEREYPELEIIEVQNQSSHELLIDRKILETFFCCDLADCPVDFSCLSAGDLYYATVSR